MLGNLADVQQAVGAGEDLDEGAKLRQANHLAQVGLADFGHGGEIADHLQSLLQPFLIARGHVDAAAVVDIDLYAGGFDNAANRLAAWSDQLTDLVGWDLQGVNLRGELGAFRLGAGKLRLQTMAEAQGAGAADIQTQINQEQRRIRLLKAEISHLEAPARLEALTTQYLGMAAPDAKHEITLADLPRIAQAGAAPTPPAKAPTP